MEEVKRRFFESSQEVTKSKEWVRGTEVLGKLGKVGRSDEVLERGRKVIGIYNKALGY